MSNGVVFPIESSRMADKDSISGLTLRATETRLIKPSTRKTNTRYEPNTWFVDVLIFISDYEVQFSEMHYNTVVCSCRALAMRRSSVMYGSLCRVQECPRNHLLTGKTM